MRCFWFLWQGFSSLVRGDLVEFRSWGQAGFVPGTNYVWHLECSRWQTYDSQLSPFDIGCYGFQGGSSVRDRYMSLHDLQELVCSRYRLGIAWFVPGAGNFRCSFQRRAIFVLGAWLGEGGAGRVEGIWFVGAGCKKVENCLKSRLTLPIVRNKLCRIGASCWSV